MCFKETGIKKIILNDAHFESKKESLLCLILYYSMFHNYILYILFFIIIITVIKCFKQKFLNFEQRFIILPISIKN